MRLRCLLGFHRWLEWSERWPCGKPATVRMCIRCEKAQIWEWVPAPGCSGWWTKLPDGLFPDIPTARASKIEA